MRQISANGLATLTTKQGIEPICIVEIDWVAGTTAQYADKAIFNIPGKVVEISELDDVAAVSGASNGQQVTVVLDDTDGSIKALLDTQDVHKRPARLYQYFTGLALTDRFELFDGYITTPIVWSERDRTVTVTILSQLELVETDTTVEESMTGPVPAPLLGKRFPMIFGEVDNAPTVQMETPVTGALLQPLGTLAGQEMLLQFPVMDTTNLDLSVLKGNYHIQFCQDVATKFDAAAQAACAASQTAAGVPPMQSPYAIQNAPTTNVVAPGSTISPISTVSLTPGISASANPDRFEKAMNTYVAMRDNYIKKAAGYVHQVVAAIDQYEIGVNCTIARRNFQIQQAELLGYGQNPVTIYGGEFFPQGEITVQIGDATFSGTMEGNQLTITSRSSAYLEKLAQGAYNMKTNVWDKYSPSYDPCLLNRTIVQQWGAEWNAQIPAPNADGDYDGTAWTAWQWDRANPYMTISYTPNLAIFNTEPILQHLWLRAGSTVRLVDQDSLDYLVSATPGTVTAVRAIKNVSGVQMLVDVPSYTVSVRQFGSASVTVVTLPAPLSSIPDEGWTDELYVSFTSTVGPNVADIIQWLIDTYTLNSCDPATFAAAAKYLANFPANFVLSDFQDILSLIRNISFQANCQLDFEEGVAYLQYLPLRPTPVDAITDSDVDAEQGIKVELTPTEDLITKLTVKWSTLPVVANEHVSQKVWGGTSYLDEVIAGLDTAALTRPNYSLVLRNNILKYGTFQATYNYYIYNDSDTALSAVQFWFGRKSCSWKRVAFTTPLHKLNIETFDAVTLNLSESRVSDGPVLALVESAKYDSQKNCIHFQCITPVLAGTMVENDAFWPVRSSE